MWPLPRHGSGSLTFLFTCFRKHISIAFPCRKAVFLFVWFFFAAVVNDIRALLSSRWMLVTAQLFWQRLLTTVPAANAHLVCVCRLWEGRLATVTGSTDSWQGFSSTGQWRLWGNLQWPSRGFWDRIVFLSQNIYRTSVSETHVFEAHPGWDGKSIRVYLKCVEDAGNKLVKILKQWKMNPTIIFRFLFPPLICTVGPLCNNQTQPDFSLCVY